jgi:hypothetical protein
MSASFEISLEDGVSAPAGKASNSLGGLFAMLRGTGDASDSLVTQFANLIDPTGTLAIVADAAGKAITFLAGKLYDGALAAIHFTQEKDALRSVFDVLQGGAGSGQRLLDGLEDLAATLPYTADRLNGWARSLLAAGIQGDALTTSIRAIAAATAIMGEQGGRSAETLIKRFAMMAEAGQSVKLDRRILAQLAEAGVSINDLAKALGVPADKLGGMSVKADALGNAMQKALIAKGEGPLKRMGQTWDSIKAKLAEGFQDAFEDLGELVGPFMTELQSLASEFFANGIASGTWKDAVKVAMRVVFEAATRTVRAIHLGFLQLEILYLRAKIALKPVSKALDSVGISGGVVNVIMYLLAATALILAVVIGALALAVFLLALPFVLAAVAIGLVVYGIYRLVGAISDGLSSLSSLAVGAFEAGQGFIEGLGNAISGGAAWVVGLITSLAQSMISAITGPLKIRSPSRVMMQIGRHTTAGLADGITQGQADVEAAARSAGGAAIGGAVDGTQATGGGQAGGGLTVNVEAGAVVINGAGGDVLKLTREALALLLEEAALQAGVA